MADWTSLIDTLNNSIVSTFGRAVVYTPQAGTEITVRGVFEATHEPEENQPGVYGVLFMRLADLPCAPARGDEVSADGVTYKVFDVEADGSGGVVLRLRQR